METRKKQSSTTRPSVTANMGRSQQAPFLPNKLSVPNRQLSRGEKARLQPLIPDAITHVSSNTNQQNRHDNLHNAILRKSQQENRNGANSVSSGKTPKFFEVHKRGQKGYNQLQDKTLPNLGKIVHGSYELNTGQEQKEDDSNENSMQFSYYGRRYAAAAALELEKQSPIPNAQIITSHQGNPKLIGISKASITQTQPPPNRRIARRESEPNSSIILAENEDSFTLKRVIKDQRGPEYDLEERMNHNLMKQFKGMFEADNYQNQVSDFQSNSNQVNSSIHLRQGVNPLIYNFIQDADSSMISQDSLGFKEKKIPLPNKLAKLPPGTGVAGQRNNLKSNERVDSSQTRKSKMSKTTQSFMPSQQLPPRARNSLQSPLVSNIRSKQALKNKIPPNSSTVAKNRMAAQLNISSVNHQTDASTAIVTTNASSDILYKKGARSISRKNEQSITRSKGKDDQIKKNPQNLGLNKLIDKQLVFAGSLAGNCQHRKKGRCIACKKHQLDGHDHSVSSSQNRKILKFNANYRQNGLCRKHGRVKCDMCSRGDSDVSETFSLSSHGSNIISKDILRLHRAAPRSEIGFNTNINQQSIKARELQQVSSKQLAVSRTRDSRNSNRGKSVSSRQKVKSLPREEMLQIGREASNYSVNQTMVVDSRTQTNSQQINELQNHLQQFRGNRPGIPKPQNFQISKVAITLPSDTGRNVNSARSLVQQAQSHSQGRQQERLPNDEDVSKNKIQRIMSSKTNISAIQRLERQKKLQQSNPGDLNDEKIKKITKEWENCDPHDENFWQKLQHENAEQGRMETLRSMQVKNQQLDVLTKQSEVFRELRMEEDMNSEMASVFGYVNKSRLRSSSGNRGPNEYQSQKTNLPPKQNLGRNIKRGTTQAQVNQNVQSVRSLMFGEGDENIMTEIDAQSLQNTFRQKLPFFKNQNVQSSAVLTDYDITDEVVQSKQFHEIVYKNTVDNINVDQNIDDLVRNKQMKLRDQVDIDDDVVYWTAMQTEKKPSQEQSEEGIEIGQIWNANHHQKSLIKETDEKEDSSSESQTPLDRVTKCNITSYDEWLEEQATKEEQRRSSIAISPKSSISNKTQEISVPKNHESQAFKGIKAVINIDAINRPKTQSSAKQNYSRNEEFKSFCKKMEAKEEQACDQQKFKEVEVILESIYVIGADQEITKQSKISQMQHTVKNPDLKSNLQSPQNFEQSGTALGEYISQEEISEKYPNSPQKDSNNLGVSTDELIYSQSVIGVLSSKSKPVFRNIVANKSRASLLKNEVIQEEMTDIKSRGNDEDSPSPQKTLVNAKETILSDSPLEEVSPLSPSRKDNEFEDEPYAFNLKAVKVQKEEVIVKNFNSETLQPKQTGKSNLNQNVKDFLQFEDSSDSELSIDYRKMGGVESDGKLKNALTNLMHTATAPVEISAVQQFTSRDQTQVLTNKRNDKLKMQSMEQEQISQMIADIDYNVSHEGMSASFYRANGNLESESALKNNLNQQQPFQAIQRELQIETGSQSFADYQPQSPQIDSGRFQILNSKIHDVSFDKATIEVSLPKVETNDVPEKMHLQSNEKMETQFIYQQDFQNPSPKRSLTQKEFEPQIQSQNNDNKTLLTQSNKIEKNGIEIEKQTISIQSPKRPRKFEDFVKKLELKNQISGKKKPIRPKFETEGNYSVIIEAQSPKIDTERTLVLTKSPKIENFGDQLLTNEIYREDKLNGQVKKEFPLQSLNQQDSLERNHQQFKIQANKKSMISPNKKIQIKNSTIQQDNVKDNLPQSESKLTDTTQKAAVLSQILQVKQLEPQLFYSQLEGQEEYDSPKELQILKKVVDFKKNQSECKPTLVLSVEPTPSKVSSGSQSPNKKRSSRSPISRLHIETVSSQLKRLEKLNFSAKEKPQKPPLKIKKESITPQVAGIFESQTKKIIVQEKLEEPTLLNDVDFFRSALEPDLISQSAQTPKSITQAVFEIMSPKVNLLPKEPLPLSPSERFPVFCFEDVFSEICEYTQRQYQPREPDPEKNPYLEYPRPPKPFQLPIIEPNKNEEQVPPSLIEIEICEPESQICDDQDKHFVKLAQIEELAAKTKLQRPQSSYSMKSNFRRPMTANSNSRSIGVQNHGWMAKDPSPIREVQFNPFIVESVEHIHNEETKDQDLFSSELVPEKNQSNVGIQTNDHHFFLIESSLEFQMQTQEKIDSQDWALSPLYDDISFAKLKNKLRPKIEDCGNQVEAQQIIEATQMKILSEIECEYNADMLKKKMSGKDRIDDGRLIELYTLGMNTLKALMFSLRLQREWEVQSQNQYAIDVEDSASMEPEDAVKLLTRCRKMYEARQMVQLILKMIVQREQLVCKITSATPEMVKLGTDLQLVLSPKAPKICNLTKESLVNVKRLSDRITSQVNTLQEEHRIFKRPFILKGQEYLEAMKREGKMLEEAFNQQFFVDDGNK